MTHFEILEDLLAKAIANLSAKKHKKYNDIIVENINVLVANIENNKSLVSAIVTSMLHKMIEPQQDIRLHKKKFANGYSARTLDTKVTTPFFKQHFQRYANKESGFLSLVTRVDIPWNLSEESNIAGRSKNTLHCFLVLLDAVENKTAKPDEILIYLFEKLHILSTKEEKIFTDAINTSDFIDIININSVLAMLRQHFSMKLSSRLPVIAI
ncbi:MAG: hypothetical protein LBB53_01395, partial [Prevotellaceae bacterium]|nr:hypothetical protein [Prevotellaceae bacterium]